MPITFVTNNLEKYSADILIDIVYPDAEKNIFSEYFDKQDPIYHYHVYKKDDIFVPHELVLLSNQNYKKLIRIFYDREKYEEKEKNYDCIFDYLHMHGCKSIFISYEQYMNRFSKNKFQIEKFLIRLEDVIVLEDLLNVVVYIEENKLNQILPKIIEHAGKDYVKNINNQIIIYDRFDFRNKEELESRNNIDESEINRYMQKSARIEELRELLGNYILRTGLSEGTIARMANIERSHINEVKNNLKKDSKKRKKLPREQLLSLAITLGLNVEEFKDFMGAAGLKFPLEDGTKEAKRDWVIMYFLENNKRKSVAEINDILYRLELELVGKKEK